MRTSLALSAAGVPLHAVDLPVAPGLRSASALVLITLGLLAPVQGWCGCATTERRLRQSRPLPAPVLNPVLAVGIVVAGLLLLIELLLR